MRTGQIEVIRAAVDLPDEWDAAAGDRLFLRRDSLLILEETNPCGQLYHIAGRPGPCSIAVTYRHKLDLLTYGVGSLRMPVTIIGIPCSVSSSGCCFDSKTETAMLDHLRDMRGTKLMLNTDPGAVAGFVSGTTLPACRLDVRWDSFSAYLGGMRSHYRYRIAKAQSRWTDITESVVDNKSFSDGLYGLYVNVFRRSRYRLEKLSLDFFRTFPSEIVAFRVGARPIAFVQLVRNGGELIFMFAGMDYSVSRKYDTYLNLLLTIVRKGIDAGCRWIDLGQTTEDVKGRLGCRLVEKGLHAAHSRGIGNLVLKAFAGALSYRRKDRDYNVFK